MPNQFVQASENFQYSATKTALHKRLKRIRGLASAHTCVDCPSSAKQWSQVHDTDGTDFYKHYEPRCVKCHCAYDEWGLRPGHSKNKGTQAYLLRARDSAGKFI